jgi:hypothetical protein
MKKALLIFLFTISPAFADDQRNVYDVIRQWEKNSESAIVDEQTTALWNSNFGDVLGNGLMFL